MKVCFSEGGFLNYLSGQKVIRSTRYRRARTALASIDTFVVNETARLPPKLNNVVPETAVRVGWRTARGVATLHGQKPWGV